MSDLTMSLPRVVRAGQPFHVAVEVAGATPGANVRVEVKKTDGPPSAWTRGAVEVRTGPTGVGDNVLEGVVLDTAGRCVIVATASDAAGDFFAAQAKVLEVVE